MEEAARQRMWVLRTTPYKEYGQLVVLFTEQFGKITAVVHGSRRAKSPLKSLLQPFNYISAVLSSKHSELCTLKEVELNCSFPLQQKELICAQYLNEILFYLLENNIPEPQIFNSYLGVLRQLAGGAPDIEVLLRNFELELLDNIGYGIDFISDYQGNRIRANVSYVYEPDNGFIPVTFESNSKYTFIGADLASMSRREFGNRRVLSAIKHICKKVINSRIGNHKIYTRALFAQYLAMRR